MADGNDPNERQNASRGPRNMQGLLRLAVENTPTTTDGEHGMDSVAAAASATLDPERQQFLEQVLSSMSVNVTEIMKNAILVLSDPNSSNDDKESALDELMNWVDNIDFANDFYKIGGFTILRPGLRNNSCGIRYRTAEVIAELVQNNPCCQKAATEAALISDLLELVDIDDSDIVRTKSMYALSGLLRNNPDAQKEFAAMDGFSVLLRALQSDVEKLKVKSSFLIWTLCSQESSFKDTLCNMGFVEQLVSLIQREHDVTHEHIVGALYSLVVDHPIGIQECQRSELNLRETLVNRIDFLKGKEEFTDELDFCEKLIKVCFSNCGQQLEDR